MSAQYKKNRIQEPILSKLAVLRSCSAGFADPRVSMENSTNQNQNRSSALRSKRSIHDSVKLD